VTEEFYEFEEHTYDRLRATGISAWSVLDVLHGGALVRRHIGSALQVAGRDRVGLWLVVSLMETNRDDRYTVIGARLLDEQEIAAIVRMRGDQR
jgi:hypothetical protein